MASLVLRIMRQDESISHVTCAALYHDTLLILLALELKFDSQQSNLLLGETSHYGYQTCTQSSVITGPRTMALAPIQSLML